MARIDPPPPPPPKLDPEDVYNPWEPPRRPALPPGFWAGFAQQALTFLAGIVVGAIVTALFF